MKKLHPLLLTAAFTLTLTACSQATAGIEHNNKSDSDQKTADKQPDKKDDNKTTKPEKEKKPEPKPINQTPYKAVKPETDAKPLKEKIDPFLVDHLPDPEDQGKPTERSVPLSQTLAKGIEDLTQGPLKDHRIVAFYGTPKSKNMGIVGRMPPEQLMKKLDEVTASYTKADPARPAVPAIELIATVAQRSPGPDGHYVQTTSDEVIRDMIELTQKHNALLILDVQLGNDTVMNEVKKVEKYLKEPNVHLAIDTEFHVSKGEVPGEDLGHVDGRDIQKAIAYVNDMVEKERLADKFVIVHQFRSDVLNHKDAIKPMEHVEVALNFDGYGRPAVKMSPYRNYVREEPIQYGGFKIFYKKDEPVLQPKDIVVMDPAPAIVDYQ